MEASRDNPWIIPVDPGQMPTLLFKAGGDGLARLIWG